MKGEFVFMIDGKIVTFDDYRKIPQNFQHIIKFIPEIPEPPHTEEQHEIIDGWHKKLQDLISIENQRYASRDNPQR